MRRPRHDLFSIGSIPVFLAFLIAAHAAAAQDSRGLAVIPPGHEALFAEMLGRAQLLPAGCSFAGASADRTLIRSTYSCPSGEVVYELHHADHAPSGATRTDRFSLVAVDGVAPEELTRALEARVRARLASLEDAPAAPAEPRTPR